MSVDSPDSGHNALIPENVTTIYEVNAGRFHRLAGQVFLLAMDMAKELEQRARQQNFSTRDWDRNDSIVNRLFGRFWHLRTYLKFPPAGLKRVVGSLRVVRLLFRQIIRSRPQRQVNYLDVAAKLATAAETGFALLWFHPQYRETHYVLLCNAASLTFCLEARELGDGNVWNDADAWKFRCMAGRFFADVLDLANVVETEPPDFATPKWNRWEYARWDFLLWTFWEAWEGIVSPAASLGTVADCFKRVARILRRVQRDTHLQANYQDVLPEMVTAAETGLDVLWFSADRQEQHWWIFLEAAREAFLYNLEECDSEEGMDDSESSAEAPPADALASVSAAAGGVRSGQQQDATPRPEAAAAESDSDSATAGERVRARLRAMGEALQTDAVRDAMRDAQQAERDKLATRHLPYPESIEEWEHLARIAEIPEEKIGDLTAGQISDHASAWGDREKIKAKLRAEANGEGGQAELAEVLRKVLDPILAIIPSKDERRSKKTQPAPATPKRRGRPNTDPEIMQREADIAEAWNRARQTGVSQVDFAKYPIVNDYVNDYGKKGDTKSKTLQKILNRVLQRGKRKRKNTLTK